MRTIFEKQKEHNRKQQKGPFLFLMLLLLAVYHVMCMDRFFLMPYIHTVSRVEKQQDRIIYQEALGVYTITTEKESFKLLQLTDIHLGGSLLSRSQDLKALKACYTLICHTRPDLVVITGDLVFPTGVKSFSLNNGAPLVQFAAFMRNTGIPWAFAYGNHDTERVATLDAREFDSLMKTLSCANPGSLLYPDIQPDISGRNNQMIEIRNTDGALRQALFLLDSNAYRNRADGSKGYDYIHDDQVAWYQKTVTALSEKEGYTIPSMAFFHIPLREYKEADERYRQGSDQVQYYYGVLGEKMSGRICCSREKSRFFDTAVELGSTKAMFCGHDHYNNQSLEYKGIRLTYGYSIDYLAMPGIERDTAQRGATLITIAPGGEFQIVPCRLSDLARK